MQDVPEIEAFGIPDHVVYTFSGLSTNVGVYKA